MKPKKRTKRKSLFGKELNLRLERDKLECYPEDLSVLLAMVGEGRISSHCTTEDFGRSRDIRGSVCF